MSTQENLSYVLQTGLYTEEGIRQFKKFQVEWPQGIQMGIWNAADEPTDPRVDSSVIETAKLVDAAKAALKFFKASGYAPNVKEQLKEALVAFDAPKVPPPQPKSEALSDICACGHDIFDHGPNQECTTCLCESYTRA